MAVGANPPSSMVLASQNFDLIFNLKKSDSILKIKDGIDMHANIQTKQQGRI